MSFIRISLLFDNVNGTVSSFAKVSFKFKVRPQISSSYLPKNIKENTKIEKGDKSEKKTEYSKRVIKAKV